MWDTVIRYSESFKVQVVSEIESGKFRNISEAGRHYGVTGGTTIKRWLLKYGKNKKIGRIIRVESTKDRDQVKALKAEIKQLKEALADTQVESVLNNAFYHILCEDKGIKDPDAYKKKLKHKL